MKCKFPMSKRDYKNQKWNTFGCGKCLPCRLKKRSSWVLRLRLEALTSITKSFWTLTLSEPNLQVASEEKRRQTIRTFFDSLRASESRAGNRTPIRYYGCLEFGGQFARPHWHFLIFNLTRNYQVPQKYRQGFPPLRQHISQWPYGHITNCEFNTATMNYVTDYLTDFNYIKQADPALAPVPYRTTKPAIGYYGLKRLVAEVAKKQSTISKVPDYLQIGDRKFPLDQWTRNKWKSIWTDEFGLKMKPDTNPRELWIQKTVLEDEILKATPNYVQSREHATETAIYEKAHRARKHREAKELAISERYENLQKAKQT